METVSVILERAQQRAKEMDLSYKGALLPIEALTCCKQHPVQN